MVEKNYCWLGKKVEGEEKNGQKNGRGGGENGEEGKGKKRGGKTPSAFFQDPFTGGPGLGEKCMKIGRYTTVIVKILRIGILYIFTASQECGLSLFGMVAGFTCKLLMPLHYLYARRGGGLIHGRNSLLVGFITENVIIINCFIGYKQ